MPGHNFKQNAEAFNTRSAGQNQLINMNNVDLRVEDLTTETGILEVTSVVAASSIDAASYTLQGGFVGSWSGAGFFVTAGAIRCSSAAVGAGVGYTTGAGGTGLQTGSRSNSVTMTGMCGAITTNNTALLPGEEATFTVNNTSVAVGDVVVVSCRSGQTANTSVVAVTRVAASAFDLTLTNLNNALSDTGAMIINFAVIKAVSV